MICCEGFAYKSQHPKYLQPVIDMMEKANECTFYNVNEFDIFVLVLKRQLEKCMIKGSSAHINVSDPRKGQLSLYEKNDSQYPVARISFFPVKGILMYDLDAKDFFDVSDRFDLVKEGGGE